MNNYEIEKKLYNFVRTNKDCLLYAQYYDPEGAFDFMRVDGDVVVYVSGSGDGFKSFDKAKAYINKNIKKEVDGIKKFLKAEKDLYTIINKFYTNPSLQKDLAKYKTKIKSLVKEMDKEIKGFYSEPEILVERFNKIVNMPIMKAVFSK